MESNWLKSNGKAGILARILLKGVTGPIDGVSYSGGSMVALEHLYKDPQLANVLNFIGERWHKWTRPIHPSKIAEVRRQLATRAIPWTREELERAVRGATGSSTFFRRKIAFFRILSQKLSSGSAPGSRRNTA